MTRRDIPIEGTVAAGFEPVRAAFIDNFLTRGELGAACAVWHRRECVVDLWGGWRDRQRTRPWDRETLVPVFSTTKGVSALTLALAHSRGILDYDARIASFWPEFAQCGKESITIRDLLAHRAGLCAIDEPITPDVLSSPVLLGEVLAKQAPHWPPGQAYGYHAISLGLYQNEILRRLDPSGRSINAFFQQEIAAPLGMSFHIGWPSEGEIENVAEIQDVNLGSAVGQLGRVPWRLALALLSPGSLTHRALRNPYFRRPRDVYRLRGIELPSSNGIGLIRDVARLYGLAATDGGGLGLAPTTVRELHAGPEPPSGRDRDLVLHAPTRYGLGFARPSRGNPFSKNPQAFGTAGLGGSFAFGDPVARLGYAYAPNRCGAALHDPREEALRTAVYQCLGE